MKDFPIFANSLEEGGLVLLTRDDNTSIPIQISLVASRPPTDGVQSLVQMVLKGLLDAPGSDIMNTSMGVGLIDLIGTQISPAIIGAIQTDFVVLLHNLEQKIKELQAVTPGLEDEETLERLVLERFSVEQDRLYIVISIITKAGLDFPLEVWI